MPNLTDIKIPITGSKALTPSETQIQGVGATPVLPYSMPEPEHARGAKLSAIRKFNISEYENILGRGQVNPNLDLSVLNENRAQNQSGWYLTKNATGQLGTTILGGTITGIGSILNFFPTTYRAISQIWDDNAKYKWDKAINEGLGSEWQRIGKDIENWGRKAMPIYQTEQAQKGGFAGGMGDATWWASMFPTVGSAAASMLPVIGQMRALQAVGKLGTMINGVGRLGSTLNKAGRALQNPYTQQIIGTLYGAHLDSMEEIVRGYDEQYQYALDLGFSEDDARKFASVYASESYNDAWAYGVLFNAIELNSMLRGIKEAPVNSISIEKGLRSNIKGLAQQGKTFVLDSETSKLNRKLIPSIGLRKTKDFFSIALSEGLEEMRVDMALNEGVITAKKELGIEDETAALTPLARMGRLVEQASSWDSFIWGAIGGGVMSVGRNGVTRILNGKAQQEAENKRATNIINGIQDTAAAIADFDGDMNIKVTETPVLDEAGNQVMNSDGTPKVNRTITDPASSLLVGIMGRIGSANGFNYAVEYFDELSKLSDAQLEEVYGANKRPVVDALRREFTIMRDIHARNMGLSWGNPFDNVLKVQASTDDYLLDYYRRQLAIVDTDIQTFDIEASNLRKQRDEALKAIDSKLHSLNVEKTVLEQEREELQKVIEDYKTQLEDKTRNKAISTLKGKRTRLVNKIKTIEDTINGLQSQIDELNTYIANQGAISTKQPNRKARKPYLLEIKNSKKSILSLQQQIANARQAIAELEVGKLQYEQELAIHNGEIADTRRKIELFENDLADYDARLNRINSDIAEQGERENNNVAEYNEAAKRLRETRNNNNQTYKSLEEARTQLSMAVMALEENVNNRDEIMAERSKLLKEVYDKQEEIEKAKDKVEETTETTNQEASQEPENVTTEVLTDSNGISYSLDDSEAPNTVDIKNKVYSVGSKFNVAESPKTVQRIEVVTDDETDFSAVMVTIKDDATGKEDTYSAKELAGMDITEIRNEVQTKFDAIYKTLYSIQDKLSADEFENHYLDTIINLHKELSDSNSDIYKALLSPIDNTELNTLRTNIIGNFIGWINEYQPTEISNENLEKANRVKQLLSDSNVRIANNLKSNLFKDWIWNLYGGDIVGYREEENAKMREAIADYIANVANVLNNNYTITDGKLTLKNINVDHNVIRAQIEGLTQIKFENLNSNFDTVRYSNFYHKITLFKNSIINEVAKSTTEFYKTNIAYINSVMNRFISKIRAIRQDEDSPLHDALVNDDGFGSQTSKIMEFATAVNNLAKEFLDYGAIPNLPARTRLHTLAQSIQPYLVSDVDALNLTGVDVITAVRQSNVLDLLRNARMAYSILSRYYNFESGTELNDDVSILNSLDVLANSVSDFIDDTESRDEFNTNDYRYYISDSMRNALDAIENTIVKLDGRQIFTDNHVYTYEDILDSIYQQTDGRNDVIKYYEPIWYALKYFKNDVNVNTIYQQMSKNGVPQEQLDALKRLFDIINKRIANPIQTTDSAYLDSNLNLRGKFLSDFFKTHIQREFETNGFKGLRRLTPEVYKIITSPEYYNPKTRVIKNNITVNGVKFKATELFDALRTLHEGQEFEVTYKDGNVDVNLDVNGKKLLIERIGLGDSETYHGIQLGRIDESGVNQYDSAFGNSYGTSKFVDTIIRKAGGSDTIFNLTKEFYKVYTEALTREQQNSDSVVSKLKSIIKELDKYGNTSKTEHSEIINAFIGAIQYNTEVEGVSPEAFDIEGLDLNKVYYLISPMFYNVRLKNLNDYVRYGLRIKNAYQNLNTKLGNDFIQSQKLITEIKEKGSAILVLKGINKSPITFADSSGYRANVNEEMQRTVTVNGKSAVNIIQRQPDADGLMLVSSLTTDTAFNNPIVEDKITSSDRHFQMYAEIQANAGENGKSYVPLHRGNLASDVADTPFNVAAMEFVTQTMSDIISDATFTSLPTDAKSGLYTLVDDTNKTRTKAHNANIRSRLAPLSEAIITSYNRGVPGAEWFNISSLYENTDPATGKTRYIKHLDFQTVVRKKNILGNGISYINRISIEYTKSGDKFTPVKLRLSRRVIPVNRTTSKVRIAKSPFTARELAQLNGIIEKSKSNKGTYAVIDLQARGITGRDLTDLLNHNLFRKLYGNMQRSVTTALQGDHYTYGVKTDDGYAAVKGQYKSKILDWAKQQGIVDKSVSSTFDSMQDFILDTGALTTSVIGIRDTNGNVVTNYTIDSIQPAMFFELKSESSDNPIRESEDMTKEFAVKAITTLSSMTSDTETNWYQKLVNITDDKVAGLRVLGVIPDFVSEDVANRIAELYDRIYTDGKTNFSIKKLSSKQDFIIAQYDKGTETIVINSNKLTKRDFTATDLGVNITHESLHKYFEQQANSKELYDKLATLISDINDTAFKVDSKEFNAKYKSDLTELELGYLRTYLKILSETPAEIVTYAFTNKQFANLANRIIVEEAPKIKKRKSLWDKIIDAILSVIGIDTITDNSLLNNVRNIVINSLDSVNSRRAKSPTSGRATSSPTGKRSAGRSPAAEPTSVTTNQTNVTNDATHDNLSVTEPIKTPDETLTENQRAAQAELDFLDDDSEITFDDNNSETLNSIDVSDIGPNIVIPGGGVGLTPTGQVFSNSSENVLNNQKNVVSSNGEYVIEFIDKYIDDNNNKIC